MQLIIAVACLCLVISAAASAQSDYRVACYVEASTQRLFHHIDPSICTHVISSSAYLDDNFSFKTWSQDADTGCTSLKKIKERNPSLKTLLGVEVKQSRLELLAQNQANLDIFIRSTLKYLKEQSYYDGLELTWVENAASDEPPKTTDTLTGLLKKLRGWIEEDVDFTNKSVLVSVTLPESSDHMSTHHDDKTLSQYVDFISLLPASLDEPQIDSAVNYWQEQGVEPEKLTMVLPAFLRRSRRREHGRHSETADLNPEKLEQPYGPVLMIAKQVCQAIKSGQTKLKTLTTFESAQSLREEVSWLLQKGFGGVGVVMLDIDNFVNSICLNCTESEKATLESKVISGSPHHPHHHSYHSHGPHSGRGHHHGRHHHHDRNGGTAHSPVESRQDDQMPNVDGNDTVHRHGHRRHGHCRHGQCRHDHFNHGRGAHDRGHHGHGHHGHAPHGDHFHHDHHSSA